MPISPAGGGRDILYTRYDNLSLHDQGAETWFIDKDGRNLGLRLFNVDWPINNYDGYFTRDSLVIYVIEKLMTAAPRNMATRSPYPRRIASGSTSNGYWPAAL